MDFETTTSYTLTVDILDNGGRESDATATIDITVMEVNDNRPIFNPQYYSAVIDEGGSMNQVILTLTASDADAGSLTNETTFISLDNTTDFTVDPSSGEVRNAVVLDYERQQTYNLIATVRDLGTPYLQSIAYVDIFVRNQNDEPPVFNPASYTRLVSEKAPVGTVIAQLMAFDADTSAASLTFSSVDNLDAHFNLDENTGVVTLVNSFDSEDTPTDINFVMVFNVNDGAQNGSQPASVIVNVIDVNDNEPIFDVDIYYGTIDEELASGENIITITARDGDITPQNNQITYSLVSSADSGNFTITGQQIQSAVVFDYEVKRSYQFEVRATNNLPAANTDKLSGRAIVIVDVIDTNDNVPVLEPSLSNGQHIRRYTNRYEHKNYFWNRSG